MIGLQEFMNPPERQIVKMRFQIDTNRINSRQSEPHMNQLEKWEENGVIELTSSDPARREMVAGNNPRRVSKTHGMICSLTYSETAPERQTLQQIETILFPNGCKDQNQRNDVEIVFNAWKYKYILITNDGGSKSQPRGILGCKRELANLGITVMKDQEAVVLVKTEIQKRDNFARRMSEKFGTPLPEWIGKD